ncbi:MAG: hypothetical protein J6K26_10585 [Lachnospiraceae bacterium]|nr:hypothetical protein [Lachnospiraceae bacterium]
MTIDEAEKIKTVVENKDYIAQLVNTVSKAMIEAFENLKIEDVNMFQLGYNKALDDFAILMKETLNHDWATTKISEQIIYNRLFDKCNEIAEQLKAGESE